MRHSSARAAVDELFVGGARRMKPLRVHLDGCLECRAYYDRTAASFRALTGRPDEMTPEELKLFAPVFPAETPGPILRFAPWIGGFALAATAALVLVVTTRTGTDGFTARGGNPVTAHPVVRPLCTHQVGGKIIVGDPAAGTCLDGDRLGFVAAGHGRRFLAVAVLEDEKVEWLVSGQDGKLGPDDTERVLGNSSAWRTGVRAVAIYGDTPIEPAAAEACAKGACPASLEREEIPLGPGAIR